MGCRVAIIGGGPGGLMTAYRLQQRCSVPFDTTIYEASSRLGGKVLTSQFVTNPVIYEAGAAELYDYSHVGEDPLRKLVEELGLHVKPMSGASIIMDEQVLNDSDDVGRIFGESTKTALAEFDTRARQWMSPQEFYDSDWSEYDADPMAEKSFEDELERVPDAMARRFLRTMVHSDLATEPHRTSASYGLQNYLMNDPGYMSLYTVEGGIEQLPQRLAGMIHADLRLKETVVRVARTREGLRVFSRHHDKTASEQYDFVVVALPSNYLPSIEWEGASLEEAMHCHHVHYDAPAHYLRVSILFREPFWRQYLKDSYFMLDAFGGCCLYDESARCKAGEFGALGWLLAGDAAMTASNLPDKELIEMVLDSLPSFLRHGREMFLEGQVHRWIGAVNGLPGGAPALDMESRHIPEPAHPNLFVVGDYLFDSTLNGVLDSADYVAEALAEQIEAASHASVEVRSAAL